MKQLILEKYKIYRLDFPVQNITKNEGGRAITVTGTEQHGAHRCVVVSVAEDNESAVVVPMTSAQNSAGGERWQVVKKSWLRTFHQGEPAYILAEQIRYADRGRFFDAEGWLGEHDQQPRDLKLPAL